MKRRTTEAAIERMDRECVAMRLRMLDRVVTGIHEEEPRPLGLKVTQLVILAQTASRGRVLPAELCRTLHLDPSTLSRNLERMRARGWLEEMPGHDERSRPFRLSASGRKLLRDAIPAWERGHRKALRVLGRDGASWLRRVTRDLA